MQNKEKKQTIYKIQKREPGFTIVQNNILDDPLLTWKEKGILCTILSHPNDFCLYEDVLKNKAKDGIKSLRTGIRGLICRGHILRRKIRDAHGRFIGYETLVFEEPHTCMTTEMPFSEVGKTDVRKRHTTNTNKRNTNIKNTTTTAEDKLLMKSSKEKNANETFPLPTSADEINTIIRDVIAITYPNGEGIKNKNNLIYSIKTKLINGELNIPEGWTEFQKRKNERIHFIEKQSAKDDEIDFKAAKEYFATLPETEQKRYIDTAKKSAKGIASVMSESTTLCVAIQLAAKERNKKT
jgi:hypothetical protein